MHDERFLRACETLLEWCRASSGEPIDIGLDEPLRFTAGRASTPAELDEFEQRFNTRLPPDYRTFMTLLGGCRIFEDRYASWLEFRPLADLPEYARTIFENAGANRFPSLLPICWIGRGGCGALDTMAHDSAFSVFWSECPTDLWGLEGETRVPFGDWLIQVVESKGADDMP